MRSLFVLALAACGNPDERVCHDVFYADQDGDAFGDPESSVEACQVPDGYTAVAGDCDDTRYSTRPGADERCNGADDDCDGSIDDDAIDPSPWYEDTDGDGYGDEADMTEGCVAPVDYAPEAGDCNVTDPAINPGADEICDGIDNDCDRLPDEDDPGLQGDLGTWYVDGDYDGFGDPLVSIEACDQPLGAVADNTDCNDDEGAAYPGAQEICDVVDNDCDGLADEDDEDVADMQEYWPDDDGDGLGAGFGSVFQCFAPSGYVDNDEDCDDGDAAVLDAVRYYEDGDGDGHGDRALGDTCSTDPEIVFVDGDCDDARADVFPGATEICDGIDDNCDGLVDDADPTTVLPIWYGDEDGDGFGVDTDIVESCVEPDAYATASGDCDDADAFTFPDAYELCDAIDNDCNGADDDDVDYVDWYVDTDGDGYGDAGDTVNDCAQPSGYELSPDDCDDDSVDVHPGAAEICDNGIDDDCDLVVDPCPVDLETADLVVAGIDEDTGIDTGMIEDDRPLGASIAVGDIDADGTSDLVLGGPPNWAGKAVFLLPGPATGSRTAEDAIEISRGTSMSRFGPGIDVGDADGDEADDLLVSSPDAHMAYVFLGPISADRNLTHADAALAGAAGDALSVVDIVRDVDGDGTGDLFVSAPGVEPAFSSGRVYLLSGAGSGAVDLTTDAVYTFEGAGSSDHLGTAVAEVGDATGDGIADLAISAIGASTGGVVYVVEGGAPAGAYEPADDPLAEISGEDLSQFGTSLASADADGDGTHDLVVGAPLVPGAADDETGAAYVFLGPFEDVLTTAHAHARWDSTIGQSHLGYAVAIDGDFDGDETPDVLLGAVDQHVAGTAGYGCAYLQTGLATGTIDVASLRSFPALARDFTGYSLRFVPDWDGDDRSEIAIGSPYADGSFGDRVGTVHVFFSDTLLP